MRLSARLGSEAFLQSCQRFYKMQKDSQVRCAFFAFRAIHLQRLWNIFSAVLGRKMRFLAWNWLPAEFTC